MLDIQNHRPLRELVYEELKQRILTGEILPGTRLMEVELAENLGVSRTPIREAIRKLEKESLVTIEPRRGAYASDLKVKDVIDILEVRQEMEGLAASLAAVRMEDRKKTKLAEVAEKYKKAVMAGDAGEMIKYDTEFHRIVVQACDNKILEQMIERLQELVIRFRYKYYEDTKRVQKQPDEHQVIIEAICAGNAEEARRAAITHIDNLKEFVRTEGV